LNVGKDQVLLKTRSLLLRSAGYDVESAFSIEDAIHRLRTTSIDLVLLCHSIPAEERQGMIRLIRDNAPSTPIVFVSAYVASADESADLSIDRGPDGLLSALHELLSKKGHRK